MDSSQPNKRVKIQVCLSPGFLSVAVCIITIFPSFLRFYYHSIVLTRLGDRRAQSIPVAHRYPLVLAAAAILRVAATPVQIKGLSPTRHKSHFMTYVMPHFSARREKVKRQSQRKRLCPNPLRSPNQRLHALLPLPLGMYIFPIQYYRLYE